MTCLKATGRPESIDTEAKLPLNFHSGLISDPDSFKLQYQLALLGIFS